ncbi:MAG: sigma-70 family RNA polymerase sigma factor [Solirubrobacterales bacterium]
MADRDLLAEQFEAHRAHLQRVAYRMLGTVGESEDAVQETWIRLSQTDAAAVENLGGWLTSVTGRVCIDMLRERRARPEDSGYSRLPEPVVQAEDGSSDPEQEALIADSVGLALLVVLDTLTPAERLAFVLHDTFGVPFEEIATIVDRSPAAARQLASRARRRVRGIAPEPDVDLTGQREVVDAFLAAAREGDFERLLAVLDPDVVFRLDAGPDSPLSTSPLEGAEAVVRQITSRGVPFAPFARPAVVNGAAGAVVVRDGRPVAVASLLVRNGRISEIDIVFDEKKLRRVRFG